MIKTMAFQILQLIINNAYMYANLNHASLCFLYCSFIQRHSVHYYNHYVAFDSHKNYHLWHNFKKSHIIFPGEQSGTQNNAYNQISSTCAKLRSRYVPHRNKYTVMKWNCSVCICAKRNSS